jgi:hypothetical protein
LYGIAHHTEHFAAGVKDERHLHAGVIDYVNKQLHAVIIRTNRLIAVGTNRRDGWQVCHARRTAILSVVYSGLRVTFTFNPAFASKGRMNLST